MARLLAVWCAGLFTALMIPPAAGQATGEEAEDPPSLFSKPVRVDGVDFEVAVKSTWGRPAEVYGEFQPGIALRISNRTDKDLTFDLGGTLRVSLKMAGGAELVEGPIGKRHFPKPMKVAAGKSETVTLPIRLVHTRIRDVCLGVHSDAPGTNWLTGDVRPGKYRLGVTLENSRTGDDAWHGEMRTETLEVKIKDGK
ncbi:MAG: hypothetical protein J5J06_09200 [Phycisphaerae bacterium]|nr:hypothetical protein [Phycisphaerae bacterium]